MSSIFDAGAEERQRERGARTGILRLPGVITIGRPLMSSAYLNPTATASGRFLRPGGRGMGTTPQSCEPSLASVCELWLHCECLLCCDWDEYVLPISFDAGFVVDNPGGESYSIESIFAEEYICACEGPPVVDRQPHPGSKLSEPHT